MELAENFFSQKSVARGRSVTPFFWAKRPLSPPPNKLPQQRNQYWLVFTKPLQWEHVAVAVNILFGTFLWCYRIQLIPTWKIAISADFDFWARQFFATWVLIIKRVIIIYNNTKPKLHLSIISYKGISMHGWSPGINQPKKKTTMVMDKFPGRNPESWLAVQTFFAIHVTFFLYWICTVRGKNSLSYATLLLSTLE